VRDVRVETLDSDRARRFVERRERRVGVNLGRKYMMGVDIVSVGDALYLSSTIQLGRSNRAIECTCTTIHHKGVVAALPQQARPSVAINTQVQSSIKWLIRAWTNRNRPTRITRKAEWVGAHRHCRNRGARVIMLCNSQYIDARAEMLSDRHGHNVAHPSAPSARGVTPDDLTSLSSSCKGAGQFQL